jgi:hypothetical protein
MMCDKIVSKKENVFLRVASSITHACTQWMRKFSFSYFILFSSHDDLERKREGLRERAKRKFLWYFDEKIVSE